PNDHCEGGTTRFLVCSEILGLVCRIRASWGVYPSRPSVFPASVAIRENRKSRSLSSSSFRSLRRILRSDPQSRSCCLLSRRLLHRRSDSPKTSLLCPVALVHLICNQPGLCTATIFIPVGRII